MDGEHKNEGRSAAGHRGDDREPRSQSAATRDEENTPHGQPTTASTREEGDEEAAKGKRAKAMFAAFSSALSKTIQASSWENAMKAFSELVPEASRECTKGLHAQYLQNIEQNATEEFKSIVAENGVVPLLNNLDTMCTAANTNPTTSSTLRPRRGLEMTPSEIARAISHTQLHHTASSCSSQEKRKSIKHTAKQRMHSRLQAMLASLQKDSAHIESKLEARRETVSKYRGKESKYRALEAKQAATEAKARSSVRELEEATIAKIKQAGMTASAELTAERQQDIELYLAQLPALRDTHPDFSKDSTSPLLSEREGASMSLKPAVTAMPSFQAHPDTASPSG